MLVFVPNICQTGIGQFSKEPAVCGVGDEVSNPDQVTAIDDRVQSQSLVDPTSYDIWRIICLGMKPVGGVELDTFVSCRFIEYVDASTPPGDPHGAIHKFRDFVISLQARVHLLQFIFPRFRISSGCLTASVNEPRLARSSPPLLVAAVSVDNRITAFPGS
jgi:hypothetical protein